MWPHGIVSTLLLFAVGGLALAAAAQEPRALDAADFGLIADGEADDGPAIARMVSTAKALGGPVVLRFPERRMVHIRTAGSRYVFDFDRASDVTLDGGGCTFLLDPYLRFMSLTNCRDITVRGLRVDFDPLPFIEGTVTRVAEAERFVEVRLRPGQGEAPSGGPTGEDGEQAFFSMLWYDGPYGLVSQHYWTARIEPTGTTDVIRVYATEDFGDFSRIQPGAARISVPVPGIAHRYGPGPCFRVHDNENIGFTDVELWSAPWFGFNLLRNQGRVAFDSVHIRPKPGTPRLMSLWRDGFHVKGNSASLRWENCIVSGMNDDAFNISTHSCVVRRVPSPERIVVGQKFPLGYIPWHKGATLAAACEETGQLRSTYRIVEVEEGPPRTMGGHPAAPAEITLTLDRPAPDLMPGAMVWDPAQANPDTLLRNCTIENSCRMQSPVRLENCTVTGLLWFYCEHIEGPFPSGIRVTDCTLRRGRGNPHKAVAFSGLPKAAQEDSAAAAPPRAIHDILIKDTTIHGGFHLEGAEHIRLENIHFAEEDAAVVMRGDHGLAQEGSTASPRP